MTWSLDGRSLRAVLVTRLRYLGDVAMATVVVEVLHRGDPTLDLGFLCEEAYAPALALQPALRRVHPLRVRRRADDGRARAVAPGAPLAAAVPTVAELEATGGARLAPPRGTCGLVRELRRPHYDLAVDLFFNPRSALLLRASGVRARVGGKTGWRRRLYTHLAGPDDVLTESRFRELAPGGLGDHLSRLTPLRHGGEEEPFLAWFARTYRDAPPLPRLAPRPLGAGAARQALEALGLPAAGGYVLLAPGATWPTKEWPVARWEALARALLARQPRPLVVLSPPARRELYAPLVRAIPPGRGGALPPLPLAEALAVVAAAALLVTVDGGIMHAAVALGRPTLALFGPTDPAIWFPYTGRGPFRVLATAPPCHPCDRHECGAFVCLPELAASTVADAAVGLLALTGDQT